MPEAIWVHFSVIAADYESQLRPGETVEVEVEGPLPFEQDGAYRYRALGVRPLHY